MSTRKINVNFVKKLLEQGFNEDSHVLGNYWCQFLNDFEHENDVKITDVNFSGEILSITVDDKRHINFSVKIERMK